MICAVCRARQGDRDVVGKAVVLLCRQSDRGGVGFAIFKFRCRCAAVFLTPCYAARGIAPVRRKGDGAHRRFPLHRGGEAADADGGDGLGHRDGGGGVHVVGGIAAGNGGDDLHRAGAHAVTVALAPLPLTVATDSSRENQVMLLFGSVAVKGTVPPTETDAACGVMVREPLLSAFTVRIRYGSGDWRLSFSTGR